ncbi:MAG: ATP-binding protein [Campylobacterota bacterium]|nr:ATP-binding protein [Campylobacterota bacterium]
MENAILKHNPHWKKEYKNLYQRDILEDLLNKLHLKQIQVLKGIRRSGKTTLFKLIINKLLENEESKSILYINLDDPYFSELYSHSKNLYKLLELSEKLTGIKVQYLFLDEVQNVHAWEKFVKTIYDNELVKKIFITGSNSSLLDGEYATLLSGRFLSQTITPPSYSEVLKYNDINSRFELVDNKIQALKICDSMMQFGSFFEVLNENKFKRDIVLSYYETIIFKDCIANNNLRDAKTFKEFVNFMISNSTNMYSYNSLSKATGINDNSVKEYIRVMQDCYLACEIKQYSYSLKEQIKTKKKIYINDNSFLAQTSFRFSKDLGKLLENFVYTELMKQNYEIYYFNKDFECDFICKKEEQIIAIQVCYELTHQNKDREVNGLKKLKLKCDKKIIITYDNADELENIDDIDIVNFWDYFS